MNRRILVWFSCGAASAVAALLAIRAARRHRIPVVVAYCDTRSEHEDNARFLSDCQRWFGHPIAVLHNGRYDDVWDVWERTGYIAGPRGARCTTELKKRIRFDFATADDLHVFGYDSDETERADRLRRTTPELSIWFPLIQAGLGKGDCFKMLESAGIRLPAMYLLGYRNNNCIGCPKGGAGYWNKIRRDFPAVFERMADLEARKGARLVQITGPDGSRRRVTLRELPPDAGRYSLEPSLSCGLSCGGEPEALAK